MEKIIEGDGVIANVINWFWKFLVVKIIVTIFAMIFLSGLVMIWNAKSIIGDIKNDQIYFDLSKTNYLLDVILFVLFIILAICINSLAWIQTISILG